MRFPVAALMAFSAISACSSFTVVVKVKQHQKERRKVVVPSSLLSLSSSCRVLSGGSSSSEGSRRSVVLAADSADDDGEDIEEWFADFDPSDYEDYGSSTSFVDSGDGPYHDYTRNTVSDSSEVDLKQIDALISSRGEFRSNRQFEDADNVRKELLEKHGVLISDKARTWRSGCSPRDDIFGGGERRRRVVNTDTLPFGHDYELSSDAGPNTSTMTTDTINKLLKERLEHKLKRNFQDADTIQQELQDAGVFVSDDMKKWRADGNPFAFKHQGDIQYTMSSGSPEPASASIKEIIESLIQKRALFKADRLYRESDKIRDELFQEHNVYVDDKTRQWRFVAPGGERVMREKFAKKFTMSPNSGEIPEGNVCEAIQKLVEKRDAARARRLFNEADKIRDMLDNQFDVQVNDKQRTWWVGNAETRFDNKYTMSPDSQEDPPQNRHDEIQELLQQRDSARSTKDFGGADRIRDILLNQFNVYVSDKQRMWSMGNNLNVDVVPETIADPSIKSIQTQGPGQKNYLSWRLRTATSDDGVEGISSAVVSSEDQEVIVEMLEKRDTHRLDRDYESADQIRDTLLEDFFVRILDNDKEWYIEEQN